MTINTDKVSRETVDKVNDKIKNLNKLNIIVAGKPVCLRKRNMCGLQLRRYKYG